MRWVDDKASKWIRREGVGSGEMGGFLENGGVYIGLRADGGITRPNLDE